MNTVGKISRGIACIGLILSLAACSKSGTNAEPEKQYPMTGQVKSLDPKVQTATIQHEAIGDWMEAMTMEFPVREKADFERLHPGDKIQATVHIKGVDYWITNIQPQSGAGTP